MKLQILGSGGAIPTPRPFCVCDVCKKARTIGAPYKRNSCSLYVHDIKALVDCGEDIADALNKSDISDVDNLFITHRHPDHTFGLRNVLQSYFDFVEEKKQKVIQLYMPKRVHEDMKIHYPSINYFVDVLGLANIVYIEHNQSVTIGDTQVTAIGFTGEKSETYGYLFEQGRKRFLYTPCDTISFQQEAQNLDLLITECGVFSHEKVKSEIGFPQLMDRLKLYAPKKTLLTHIEEIEINAWGLDYLEKMKNTYKDVPFDFAHDGLIIDL
ncbi:Metal-dependent hydrolases of the beta-lactamase superfamily I [candidate division SR1 bacterium RAAC1_SR1_1]|nr:Metal-dependent hydrolases of the beta-lactamase superfamily I [candidate division SR1 bacterium RAAC1_SR1_1]